MLYSPQIFEAFTALTSTGNAQTPRVLCQKGPTIPRSRTSRQNVIHPKPIRHTAFFKDDKGRLASAEGIWSPPVQRGNYRRNLPRRCW